MSEGKALDGFPDFLPPLPPCLPHFFASKGFGRVCYRILPLFYLCGQEVILEWLLHENIISLDTLGSSTYKQVEKQSCDPPGLEGSTFLKIP